MNKKLENVLLLATDHNITKAYIHKLDGMGLRPSRILRLNWRNSSYSNEIEGLTEHEFTIAAKKINTTLKIRNVFTGDLAPGTDTILTAVGWEYQNITIDHINDEKLIRFLRDSVDEKYIIFCGGGILRKQILNSGKRFIHVHPGIVPEVKGADGLLWSALLYDQIGMSAFFMNQGIDTGDIVKARSYTIPDLDLGVVRSSSKAVKDLLINYIDPHYRAELLGSLFSNNPDPANWKTCKQNPGAGKTYYFMHDALLPRALGKFFKPEKQKVS